MTDLEAVVRSLTPAQAIALEAACRAERFEQLDHLLMRRVRKYAIFRNGQRISEPMSYEMAKQQAGTGDKVQLAD